MKLVSKFRNMMPEPTVSMSASDIPNLNSLRRGAGRGRGRSRLEPIHESSSGCKDTIIQQTDNDAATSRLSAIEAGYLYDPFAKLLAHGGSADRRLPLMNRGTYVRTAAIDHLVEEFLSSDLKQPRQLVSLGAGSDTRFFRLRQKYPDTPLIYHEFDFASNTAQKIRQMQTPGFISSIKRDCDVDFEAKDFIDECSLKFRARNYAYYVHPLDLRSLSRPRRNLAQTEQEMSQWEISPSTPTLVLSECCLVYLSPEEADAALSFFTVGFQHFNTSIGVIIYEPIQPHDAFGKTMVANLTARGIHLQTLNAHDSLSAQKERLEGCGFESKVLEDGVAGAGAGAVDVDFIWRAWTDQEEKKRIEGLEWMDEIEEWRLLAKHYCVAWGWREAETDVGNSIFSKWTQLPVQNLKG